jgi:hypothetical protein
MFFNVEHIEQTKNNVNTPTGYPYRDLWVAARTPRQTIRKAFQRVWPLGRPLLPERWHQGKRRKRNCVRGGKKGPALEEEVSCGGKYWGGASLCPWRRGLIGLGTGSRAVLCRPVSARSRMTNPLSGM